MIDWKLIGIGHEFYDKTVDDLDFAVRALPSAVPARVEAVELWKVNALEDVRR